MRSRFDTALSLGAHCDVAFAMRWFFGQKTTSPFDWFVTPFSSVAPIIETRGAKLGESFEVVQNGGSVQCLNYGVLYHHEFPHSPTTGNLQFSKDAIEQCRSKLLYKMQEMEKIARSRRTLFVRFAVATDIAGDHHIQNPVTPDEIIRLDIALRDFCGHDDFGLTIVQQQGEGRNCGSILDHAALPARVSIRNESFKNGFGPSHHADWTSFWEDHGFSRSDRIFQSHSVEHLDGMDAEAAGRAVRG